MPRDPAKKRERLLKRRAEFLEALLPELHRLALELHSGQYAPNQTEYVMYAEEALNRATISSVFGKWKNVCEACGLELAEPGYYWRKAQKRREEWDALLKEPRISSAAKRKEEQALLLAPLGLPVKPQPRQEIWRSGGKLWQGTAWEVR